jgi:hypothetical protein
MPPTDRLLSVTPGYIISTIRTVCKHLDINSPPREKDVRKSSRQSQKNGVYSEQVNRIGSHMQRSGVALWSARDNERSEAAPLWYLRRQAAARRRPGNPGDRACFCNTTAAPRRRASLVSALQKAVFALCQRGGINKILQNQI